MSIREIKQKPQSNPFNESPYVTLCVCIVVKDRTKKMDLCVFCYVEKEPDDFGSVNCIRSAIAYLGGGHVPSAESCLLVSRIIKDDVLSIPY